jgi:hypothetical protein
MTPKQSASTFPQNPEPVGKDPKRFPYRLADPVDGRLGESFATRVEADTAARASGARVMHFDGIGWRGATPADK